MDKNFIQMCIAQSLKGFNNVDKTFCLRFKKFLKGITWQLIRMEKASQYTKEKIKKTNVVSQYQLV